jgi:hypothetical protein
VKNTRKNQDQTGHILTDKRQQSSALLVRQFMAAEQDNEHYPLAKEVTDKPPISK